jgi:hypothetical protein
MVSVARCPYCFTDLDATEEQVGCSRCGTPHHKACFLEHGRCVTLMCGSLGYTTVQGLALEARRHLTVQVGPDRHPFLIRAGYRYGDPRWLEVESLRPELTHVAAPSLEVGLAGPAFSPGDEVIGAVTLSLPAAVRARALRLVLRAEQTTPGSVLPSTLLEREAVLAGFPWAGHLRALGLTVKTLLHIEHEDELIWLVAGVSRWTFRFRLDPLHPVRPDAEPVSVQTELVAYADVPAGADIVGRTLLPITRSKP